MTDETRFRAALCISFFLHFMLLHASWGYDTVKPGKGERLTQEVTSSAPLFSETVSVALESVSETAPPGEGADRRQKERRAFIDAVSSAIHARRFTSPEADRALIGLAWFSFTVTPDGAFKNVSLATSSGNPVLDRVALFAVNGASGAVKRPDSLGQDEIPLVMAVKYQYDL